LRDLFDSIKWSHTELVHARFPKIGSSGLLMASRWPIHQTRGVLFGGGTGPDAFADKGILSLTLDINGTRIRISNTHIQNPDEVMGKQVTNRQLNDVLQHVADSDIVLGDFNVEPEYNPITHKHHWKYLVCPNASTFGLGKESKTIDYAYSHLNGNATALEGVNVSDHKPILFTFDYIRNYK
jgi:endonuclease/exonuclease/phosphatase (EEP) superfamily protein YafD